MDDLIKALWTVYNGVGATAVALRAALSGGMWLGQAPQTISGTYIIVTPLASPTEFAMGAANTAECTIQFLICDPDNVGNIATAKAAFISLYQDNLATMNSHRMLFARPMDSGVPMRDPDSDGYMCPLVFRFIIGSS